MNKKSTAEIRKMFLHFFYNKKHEIIPSSSLVPNNDSTLLFTNSGMVQFKNIFLAQEKCNYKRVATAQRCVRAGGKHNDLQNVGYTSRHHTFFEMLGNFSFSDYFKKEAISYAWELLTGRQWFNLSPQKLLITIYENDEETFEIWTKDIGISKERIIRIGDNKGEVYSSDNFWQMGNTGPCGPCTEIFYDRGDNFQGAAPGNLKKQNDDRYIEIWNIVFIQFNRHSDGTLYKLPKPSIDTGMGLERIATVMQNVDSNYKTDTFIKLIRSAAQLLNVSDLNHSSLYVITDHIRSSSFLISDGVIPSNENRGYVLRRIIRRAIRHGNILGAKETFFYKLVKPLIEAMEIIGNDLKSKQTEIENILKNEEEKFSNTLQRGVKLLNNKLNCLESNILDGETVFYLYDTFGFPVDLTAEVCMEHNVKIDELGFKLHMEKQRQRGRKGSNFNSNCIALTNINLSSKFKGYEHFELYGIVQEILVNNHQVNSIVLDQEATIFLDKTPFYSESGGQVGDTGKLIIGDMLEFNVINTQNYGSAIGHIGVLKKGDLCLGNRLYAHIDILRRMRICRNHSATHLLHASLRQILGEHVVQKGSLVNESYLRFDFQHFNCLTRKEIGQIEKIVNAKIRENILVQTTIMDIDSAKNKDNIIALFDKKYDKMVRVIQINDFSIELCKGTHVSRTGDIGFFCIRSVSNIASNVIRIEAITGENAINNFHDQRNQLEDISDLLKYPNNNVQQKVLFLVNHIDKLKRDFKKLHIQQVDREVSFLKAQAIKFKGSSLIVNQLNNLEPNTMRLIIEKIKSQLHSAIIVLATIHKNEIFLIAAVTKDLVNLVKANDLINDIVTRIGGKGGGSPHIAQMGARNVDLLSCNILTDVHNWICYRL